MSESLFEQYRAALRRGHMAALAGELDEALAAYDAAAHLVPERALPLASRGTVLHRLDRWPEAAEAFDRALHLAPDDEASLRARASARAERDLRSGAAADFERLAFVLDVAGRAGPAADAARRAAELEPTATRTALADRLGAAASHLAEPVPATPEAAQSAPELAVGQAAEAAPMPDDLWTAALDARRLEGLSEERGANGVAAAAPEAAAPLDEAHPEPTPDPEQGDPTLAPLSHPAAYDVLEALRAELDADKRLAAEAAAAAPTADEAPDAQRTPDATAEPQVAGAGDGAEGLAADGSTNGTWPGIDLPSPPPPPIEGPPPDPEELLSEAALVLEQGEVDAARELMLTAARVHRDAGRLDAALDIGVNLLSIAPGDPNVHLAIANLQLDRGWTDVATEKLELLVRLTSLTGDTQAEADVHGLAAERLRDDPAPSMARR